MSGALKALERVTLFVLSQSAPEFSKADNEQQRQAGQTVWRRYRDETLRDLDIIEATLKAK